jgi:hypothetical protein
MEKNLSNMIEKLVKSEMDLDGKENLSFFFFSPSEEIQNEDLNRDYGQEISSQLCRLTSHRIPLSKLCSSYRCLE